jgi:hypothetical protein
MLSIPTDSAEILQQKSHALKQKQVNAIENCFTTFTQIVQRLLNKIFNPQILDEIITEIHGFTDFEYKHAINNEKFPLFMKELTNAGFEIDFSALPPKFQFITFEYYQYDNMDNPVKRIIVNGTRDDECSDDGEDGECMVIVNK